MQRENVGIQRCAKAPNRRWSTTISSQETGLARSKEHQDNGLMIVQIPSDDLFDHEAIRNSREFLVKNHDRPGKRSMNELIEIIQWVL